jgi:RNA polymerase sigma-B factor
MTPQGFALAPMRGGRGADDLVTLFDGCWAGDAQARETIITRFLPLARAMARRYDGRGEPFDDLAQVASIGLIKAVDGCSPGRVDAFTTYATKMILGEIRRHFRDATWRVHVPRPLRERAQRVAQADRAIRAPFAARARVEAIAKSLDLEPSEVAEAQQVWSAYRAVSLDATPSLVERLGTTGSKRLAVNGSEYERAEVSIGVARGLRALSRRDQTVVLLRLCCDLTQREIAGLIGVSQMHISRILLGNGVAVAAACGLGDV